MWQPPSSPEDRDFEARVAAVNLNLESLLDPAQLNISDKPDLWAHQQAFLRQAIWPHGLDAFLIMYLSSVGIHVRNLSRTRDALFAEQHLPVVQLVLRRSLDGKHCAMTELVKQIYNPKSDAFSSFRELFKHQLLDEFAHVRIWTYDTVKRVARYSGKEYIAGYKIVAGELLLLFHTHVYMYWHRRQDRWFRDNRSLD
jgi:hypothetical protein